MRRVAIVAATLAVFAAWASARTAGPPILLKSSDLPMPIESEVLQRQFAALSVMSDVQVEYSARGPIDSISGDTGVVLPAGVQKLKIGASASSVLEAFGAVLLATGSESLTVRKSSHPQLEGWGIVLDENIRGIPVVDARVALKVNEKTGRVTFLGALFLPDRNLPAKPELSGKQAWQALVRALEASGDAVAGSTQEAEKPRLAYFGVWPESTHPQIVWEMHVAFICPTGRMDQELVWIDAIDGTVAGRRSTISYMTDPGPCQAAELKQADCRSEPHPLAGVASHGASCSGSSAKPRLIVTRQGCTNDFHLMWPEIPGAAQYHVISAPADLGWAFARTLGAGNIHQCTTTVAAPTLVKMRPCDGCGCGEWSAELLMDPKAECETAGGN